MLLSLPTAMQAPAPAQDTESSASPTGGDLAACQDVPFQAKVVVSGPGDPEVLTARQLAALAQERLSTKRFLPGTDCQDVPFQVMALKSNPACMQNVEVGHEMLL